MSECFGQIRTGFSREDRSWAKTDHGESKNILTIQFYKKINISFCIIGTIDVSPDIGATFHYREIKTKDTCKTISETTTKNTILLDKRKHIQNNINRHFTALGL